MKQDSAVAGYYFNQMVSAVRVDRIGDHIETFEGSNVIWSLAVSPDGSRVASSCGGNTISVWDLEGKLVAGPFIGHADAVVAATFSPDGTYIASGSKDRMIMIWELDSGEVVSGPFEGHTGSVLFVTFSPDGTRIASGATDNTVRIWDPETGECVAGPFYGHNKSVISIYISRGGSHIVSASQDKTIIVWDAGAAKVKLEPLEEYKDGWVNCLAFSPDTSHIAWGFAGRKGIVICDAGNGAVICRISSGHTLGISAVDFSPDGRYVVSGSYDGTICIWEAENGNPVYGPFGHTGSILSAKFSPDGTRVIAGSRDHTIRVWDLERVAVTSGLIEGAGQAPNPERGLLDWTFARNGWIKGKHDELLLWAPRDNLSSLWHPYSTVVFGCAFSTKVDFRNAALGKRWQECFRPD